VNASTDLFLCLDQGGHASRAVVFDRCGDKVMELSCDTETMLDDPRVELDADSLLAGMLQLINSTASQLGSDAQRVVAAGLATQRSNIACWHKGTGQPLAPILSWQDRRAGELLRGLDLAWVHAKTGLYANAHYGASKLAWCLRQLPEVMDAAQAGDLCMGPMASFLQTRLTTRQHNPVSNPYLGYADPANASRTLLYNLQIRDWDQELCDHFGIDIETLPTCVPSLYDFGHLSWPERKLPLRVVSGDLSTAAFVHGMPQEDIAYITLGTGAFVQRILRQTVETDLRLLNGIVWDDGEQALYSIEGTVNGAGSALEWFCGHSGMEQRELLQQLPLWCEQTSLPPLFTNGVSGLGSPFWQADFSPRFAGAGDVAAQAVAVVESIVFLLCENLTLMERYLPAPSQLLLSGGLAALDGLCQRLADLSGVEVVRSAETEGTAKGLAYLLADMPQIWPAAMEQTFKSRANPSLRKRYTQWQQIIYTETGYTEKVTESSL